MMKLFTLTVGKPDSMFDVSTNDYTKRIARFCSFKEEHVPKAKRPGDVEAEGEALLSRVQGGAYLFALDVAGKELSSEELATLLGGLMDEGRNACFLIGGAFGIGENVRKRADMRLSLSKMTMSHDVARAVLYEQIYRAFTIINNMPYHK